MRILYAMPGYKPAYRLGGPIMSVSAAAERLVAKGHEVIVFASNSNLDRNLDVPLGRPVDVNGVEVWYFEREEPLQRWLGFVPYLSRSIGFMYCPAMKPALERIMPDIDVVDTQMPFVYPTYIGARTALRFSKPLFYHQRGNFLDSHIQRRKLKKDFYVSFFEKPVLRRSTGLIALTEAERNAFRRLAPGTPCEVIPNGVDIPAPRPGAAERIEARWGIDRHVPLILFLGRLHPTKGADKLLDAFASIERRFPSAVLMVAGPDEWQMEAKWQARIAQSGLAGRVIFPGMITGDDKADVLDRADLFCLPSSGEGFSVAVLEALAAGTPVLLSPHCNFPEVEPAGAGLVVAVDASAVAEGMATLLADPERLQRMGAAGKALVAERYSWDVIVDRLVDFYGRAA